MIEIQPPNYDYEYYTSIFLAGSIEMDTADEWQQKVIQSFNDYAITFFNPRRNDWDNNITQSINDEKFVEQVEWELDHLEIADIIVFYFDPNTKSPITLMELGLCASNSDKKTIMVCCPDGFWRKGNVDIICKRYNIETYNNLEQLIDGIKRNRYVDKY